MAIKTIEYKISVSGITPSVEQSAGMQGDHCVTKISISIDDELYSLIMRNYENSNLLYRFDVYDGVGIIWQSEVKPLDQNPSLMLEECHTRHSGKIKAYLVITALSEDNQTEMELYNFPCVLKLENREEGVCQDGENYESVSALVTQAESSAAEAREFANEVIEKLKNGEFDGKDGVSVTHSFDGTVLKITSASGTTTVDLKGPKGDKGESGKDAVTDKSYSPQSENAQSGKAVAEAANGRTPKPTLEVGAPIKTVSVMNHNDYTIITDPDTTISEYIANDSAFENVIVDDGAVWGKENVTLANGCIPTRDNHGNLWTGAPVDEADCANKKYVDEIVGDIEDLLGGI